MPVQSNVVEPELYAFEIGTMSLNGSVTDRGDGRCTVRGKFDDTATNNEQHFEFRSVARKSFADLFRSFADNIAPVQDGAYSFWCDLHVAELEGRPSLVHDEDSNTWNLALDDMECPHSDERLSCRPAWRMGRVALDGGAM
ncbi:hypothetical protein [Amycolatopsis sp. CA-230715]|uniref:hypothetical protein n=1 Tax=Amycolatopsis sp. CA-230715 TaxID=2745196 RepID=UPI001C023C18|nr:hypothetical protein [Amycolatopsis sp. CA-230715]QWF78668.1 hypothetical protein HUW46_02066 [Amycolatopsis sp. CA-230715]